MSAGEPTLEVRAATAADLPSLETLERQAFPEPWSRRLLAEELRQPISLALVAAEGGEVVGYASFRRAADEAELLRVAVAPDRRGRGVARHLVQAGLEEIARQGVGRCFLEVRRHNAPARALYRRLGFREVGLRRAYYPDGSDALILSRRLEPTPPPAPADAAGCLDRSPGR